MEAANQLVSFCENKSGVTIRVTAKSAYVGGIEGNYKEGTNGTNHLKDCVNNGTLISVTSTASSFVGGIMGSGNTGDIRSCSNHCPILAHVAANSRVGGVRGACTGAGRCHASSNTAKVEVYCTGTGTVGVAGISAQTNGQLNTCTNSGEVYLESSGSTNYVAGVASQNGANGSSSASNANVTFKYTGSAASPVIYAALGIGHHSGGNPTYYGTYGGTLILDMGSASAPTLYCGAIIGLLSGTAVANFGDASHPVKILSTANINGRTPSSDASSPDYFSAEGFLIGSNTGTISPSVNITNVTLQ